MLNYFRKNTELPYVKAQKHAGNAFRIGEVVKNPSESNYSAFDLIDGSHSFKAAVPNGYVEYQVRTRHGGSVFFFNFELARKMGLIAKNHPDVLSPELRKKILETFSLVIINEYDIQNEVPIPEKDIRKNTYMATRYLQLQHPSKQGKTSGDGRGIWNGEFKHRGTTWDISSSGTGATCLSPAHAQTKKFFKTGDKAVGYGNGYQSLNDGLSAALMSEIFHQNGIDTEQTLAIISFEGGCSINVRASKNLLRPAHFFHHSKQGNLAGLQSSIDFFIDRQLENGDWEDHSYARNKKTRYQNLAEQMALTFSKITARFESDYIFCWLDWDGDNILANGGIIDYGSIRQFGLYHWEYRYDDVDRMSTNIPEQRLKARYIVQNFAQIKNFIETGRKRNIKHFKNDPLLKLFDQNFKKTLNELLLKKLGLNEPQVAHALKAFPGLVKKLKKTHSYFEKTKSSRGIYKTADGITCDAIFCMRDLHLELPKRYLESFEPLKPQDFIALIRSSYAKKKDLRVDAYRIKKIKNFQKYYLKIMNLISSHFHGGNLRKTLLEITMRSSISNHQNRITGDALLHMTSSLIRNHKNLSFEEKHQVIQHLVQYQVDQILPSLTPETKPAKIVSRNIKAIRDYREGF